MFNRGSGRLYLGQLVSSGESTKAFINTRGIFTNEIKNIDQTVIQGSSTTTGSEKVN
jgi:hypothetical protein